MKRTLSITIDDDAEMIATEGRSLFSVIELLGIAEHLRIDAAGLTFASMRYADRQAEEEKEGEATK